MSEEQKYVVVYKPVPRDQMRSASDAEKLPPPLYFYQLHSGGLGSCLAFNDATVFDSIEDANKAARRQPLLDDHLPAQIFRIVEKKEYTLGDPL